jgi:CheY-like chemotaxis protein
MEPGRTVLVVEHEVLIAMMLTDAFEDIGLATVSAARGKDAIALLEKLESIDVLITDIDLAGAVSGQEVAERARELHPDIAVVFATGRSDLWGENMILPGSRFVPKPYGAADMLAAVASLVAPSSPRRGTIH